MHTGGGALSSCSQLPVKCSLWRTGDSLAPHPGCLFSTRVFPDGLQSATLSIALSALSVAPLYSVLFFQACACVQVCTNAEVFSTSTAYFWTTAGAGEITRDPCICISPRAPSPLALASPPCFTGNVRLFICIVLQQARESNPTSFALLQLQSCSTRSLAILRCQLSIYSSLAS